MGPPLGRRFHRRIDRRLPAVMFHAGFLPHDMEDAEFQKLAQRIEVVAAIFAQEGLDLSV